MTDDRRAVAKGIAFRVVAPTIALGIPLAVTLRREDWTAAGIVGALLVFQVGFRTFWFVVDRRQARVD